MRASKIQLVIALFFGIGSASAAQHAPDIDLGPLQGRFLSTPADLSIIVKLKTAIANNNRGTFEVSMGSLDDVENSDLYDKLSPPVKYVVDVTYGWAAFSLGLDKQAHRAYTRATALKTAPKQIWFMRMRSAEMDRDFADAYIGFKTYRSRWPLEQIPFNDGSVHAFEQGFSTLPEGLNAQLAFEGYLESTNWIPTDEYFSRDVIWFHLAQNLFSIGKKAEAFEVVKRISDPAVLSVVLADKRFDGVLTNESPNDAVKTATKVLYEKTKSMLATDPKSIEASSALADRLLWLNRPEEALSLINTAIIAGSQLSTLERRRYAFDENYDHALVVKAYMLFELGRHEEALAIMSTVGGGGRSNGANVGMPLVTAQWLIELGRGKEALAVLAPINEDALNLEGKADLAVFRACAASEVHDANVLTSNLTYLRAHTIDKPSAIINALLCTGNIEAAGDAAVAGLKNPREMALTLQRLQIYAKAKSVTGTRSGWEANLDRVRRLPRVVDAVKSVGRINRYELREYAALY